ncbi:MAG: SRPBCC domain-containing protein [Microbacteriaceae bacterium]|nr:SRPBCC domain-containing protein [Microbacteriaceae bacterium]
MPSKRVVSAPPGAQTISYTREFEAPAALVFRAHAQPGLVSKWTGPAGTEVWMREWDARTGGAWSYVVVGESGEWGFHGVFHEVTEPRRIVMTFEFEGHPEHPNLEILTFVDLEGGRCRVEGLSLFPTLKDRDDMLSDMDSGMDENFARLDALIAAGELG